MNSVSLPPVNESNPNPLAQPSRTIQLPPRTALNTTRFERLLALRSKKQLNNPHPSVNKSPKFLPIAKVDHARAGPSNAMNIIDLTADNDDDDQDSELSPSVDGNIYDDDPSDDPFDEDIFYPAPEQRSRANIAPDINGYAAPAPQAIHQAPPHRPLAFNPPPQMPDQPANPFGAAYVMGDFILDDDFDDENFARAYEQLSQPPVPQAPAPHAEPIARFQPQAQAQVPALEPVPQLETEDDCIAAVLGLFPDICPDHVSELWSKVARSSDRLIAHILDKMEKSSPYPKAKDKQKTLKRKREIDEDAAAELKYGAPGHAAPLDVIIRTYIKNILQVEFPETPMVFIYATLEQSQHRLFQAYRVLEEAQRAFNPADPPYNKIKNARKSQAEFRDANIQEYIDNPGADPARTEILRELQAARKIRSKAEAKRELEREAEREEEANEQRAVAEGTMQECGCCFGDYPLNRMIHCDADTMHWFCKACAKQTADTEIGNSKYILRCMSMDGCEGGFSSDQRSLFLDEKTKIALERNEQEAVLRMAGIENLESCPFCPYAAEYPPVEINKEFRCEAPDCEKVSCRLCKLESHIPKSCDEFMKENGLSIRRQIEEAMSAALIRKCNKCGTPFVKDEGCNKMTCTRNGCYNVQCYVCSASCSYDHFDDQNRGGRKGNCPLFESTFARHDIDVGKAAKEAIEKVRAEHPEYTEEDLKVHVSENVLKDDEQRKQRDPRAHLAAAAQMRRADHPLLNAIPIVRYMGDLPIPLPDVEANPFQARRRMRLPMYEMEDPMYQMNFDHDVEALVPNMDFLNQGAMNVQIAPPAPAPPPLVPNIERFGFDNFDFVNQGLAQDPGPGLAQGQAMVGANPRAIPDNMLRIGNFVLAQQPGQGKTRTPSKAQYSAGPAEAVNRNWRQIAAERDGSFAERARLLVERQQIHAEQQRIQAEQQRLQAEHAAREARRAARGANLAADQARHAAALQELQRRGQLRRARFQ